MKGVRIAVIAALVGLGCGQDDGGDEVAAQAPEAVAPVVVGDEAPAEGDELTQLRARVAELEGRLAECSCPVAEGAAAEGGTETVPVPAGAEAPEAVDVPPREESRAASTAETAEGERAPTKTGPRRREPTLLGTLLGDEEEAERERRRARRESRRGSADEEPIELPNPARVLLGD